MTEGYPFSAAASALGYLYQCRTALVFALKRCKVEIDFSVALETLDDIVFEATGSPFELIQTKHQVRSTSSLGDASPELWKTLRVWAEQTTSGAIPANARLVLLTNGHCVDGTAACGLRLEPRDVTVALRKLQQVAQTSSNASNAAAYAAYLGLGSEGQRALLERVTVIDGQPSATDLAAEMRAVLHFVTAPAHIDSVCQRIEGWWLSRVVRQLQSDLVTPLKGEEIESAIDDLRQQFRRDSLPVDTDILETVVDGAAYADAVFVQQLRLAAVEKARLLIFVRDYYRAYTQRSRWLREDLVQLGELGSYESKLVEEWERVFARVREELGATASEELKLQAAKNVLKWTEEADMPIRPGVSHPTIARGSFQMLADDMRVGWHCEFRERLSHLLSSEPA